MCLVRTEMQKVQLSNNSTSDLKYVLTFLLTPSYGRTGLLYSEWIPAWWLWLYSSIFDWRLNCNYYHCDRAWHVEGGGWCIHVNTLNIYCSAIIQPSRTNYHEFLNNEPSWGSSQDLEWSFIRWWSSFNFIPVNDHHHTSLPDYSLESIIVFPYLQMVWSDSRPLSDNMKWRYSVALFSKQESESCWLKC